MALFTFILKAKLSRSARLGVAQIHWDGYKKLSCLACATWNSRNPLEYSCKKGRNCSTTSVRFPPTHRWLYFFGMELSCCCPGNSQSIRWFCMRLRRCFQSWWWHPINGIKNGCVLRRRLACLFSVFRCWSICSVSGSTELRLVWIIAARWLTAFEIKVVRDGESSFSYCRNSDRSTRVRREGITITAGSIDCYSVDLGSGRRCRDPSHLAAGDAQLCCDRSVATALPP